MMIISAVVITICGGTSIITPSYLHMWQKLVAVVGILPVLMLGIQSNGNKSTPGGTLGFFHLFVFQSLGDSTLTPASQPASQPGVHLVSLCHLCPPPSPVCIEWADGKAVCQVCMQPVLNLALALHVDGSWPLSTRVLLLLLSAHPPIISGVFWGGPDAHQYN